MTARLVYIVKYIDGEGGCSSESGSWMLGVAMEMENKGLLERMAGWCWCVISRTGGFMFATRHHHCVMRQASFPFSFSSHLSLGSPRFSVLRRLSHSSMSTSCGCCVFNSLVDALV